MLHCFVSLFQVIFRYFITKIIIGRYIIIIVDFTTDNYRVVFYVLTCKG